jgi:hypothetical protein
MSVNPALKTVRYALRKAEQLKTSLIYFQVTLPTVVEAISRLGSAEESLERTGSLHPIAIRCKEGRQGSTTTEGATLFKKRILRLAPHADPIKMQVLFMETEKLLQKFKHPDPYRPPTAPGGV